jgi:hypothetical protein
MDGMKGKANFRGILTALEDADEKVRQAEQMRRSLHHDIVKELVANHDYDLLKIDVAMMRRYAR